MSRLQEYLSEIRALSGLKNAILYGITVFKKEKEIEFSLITDKTYTQAEENEASDISAKYIPSGFGAKMKIIKRVPDKEIIKNKIYAYVAAKFPAASAFMSEEHIEVEMLSSGAHFVVAIASGEQALF